MPVVACFDNDAFVPELWAQEGLAILEENMVAANLVHRDFENQIASFGDVVNTRRPGEFKKKRRSDGSAYVAQAANATNVRVPLDQWFYNTFFIKDGEASLSFQDLISTYLLPAMQVVARSVDCAVLGQIHRFLRAPEKRAGKLNKLTSATSHEVVLDARKILNDDKAYPQGRSLILSSAAETSLLKNDLFIRADKRGDGGSALETARLGHILGFDTYLDVNVNSISGGDTETRITIDDAQAAGDGGAQDVTLNSAADPVVGQFITIDGNDQPTYISAVTGSSPVTAIEVNEVNKHSSGIAATSILYKTCLVNHPDAGTYAAGWVEEVNVDTYTTAKAPQTGQLIAFGTGASRRTYTVIESTDNGSDCDLLLDRPLEVAVANNAVAYPGPSGSLNWALHREALALVTRPLALPPQSHGVMAGVAVYNDLAMRVVMQYDSSTGGTRVNLEMLAGLAQLDEKLAVCVLG
jgi:hypothetical protein